MTTGRDVPQTRRLHLPALDGIRGIAIFVVIVHNAAWIAGSSSQFVVKLFVAIAAAGWVGVSLFFALSGFLITGILLDSKQCPRYFRAFYIRRTLRIFPLYYFFVALAVFVAVPLAWSPAWAAEMRAGQWPFWLYLSNWRTGPGVLGMTHLWSLAVEEQFYLAWPLIVYVLRRRGLMALTITMIVSGPLVRFGLTAAGLAPDGPYLFTIARWDALAAGALLAIIIRNARHRADVIAVRAKLAALLGGVLALLLIAERGFHSDDAVVAIVGQSIFVGLSFCLLSYAIEPAAGDTRTPQLLGSGVLRILGKYSYALYIFHAPLHHSLKTTLGPWVAGVDDSWRLLRVVAYITLIFVLSFVAALVSWRVIEQPFLRLKEKWAPSGHEGQSGIASGFAVVDSVESPVLRKTHSA